MMKCWFFVVLTVEVWVLTSQSALQSPAILRFTQSADAVGPNEDITFYCETLGRDTYWKVNDISPQHNVYNENRTVHNDTAGFKHTSLWLHIQANSTANNTKITCVVSPLEMDTYFIIAGPPSKPLPHITYSNDGLSLTVSWDEPFTLSRFHITHYTLQVINTSSTVSPSPLSVGLSRLYTANITALPSTCDELEYVVTAFNDIGNSTGTVSGGFPVSIASVDIHWRALYQLDGNPHLEVWYKPSPGCSYQVVSYRVQLEDATGVSVPLNSSDHLYSVHTGLTSGASYTVVVEASSIAGTTVTRQEIVINEQNLHGNYEQQITFLSATSGALAGLFIIFFILSMVFACLLCRQKRLLMKRQTTRMHNEIVASPDVTQRPTSLQTKLATTNPIYEGPLYESPNGEPLRALLGSTPSTPNTPLDSPRYIFDVLPPNLPPPRKSSTASNTSFYETLDAPAMSSEARKMESASEAPVVNTVGDAYTVMRPASVRPLRASRPSPLVIPSLSTLSEV